MEYDFYFNEQKKPEASFSSGFCAFGLWLNTELACVQSATIMAGQIFSFIAVLNASPWKAHVFSGVEFVLELSGEGVRVCSRSLYNTGFVGEQEPLELDGEYSVEAINHFDNTDFYDGQLVAECGLEDFKLALFAWLEFIECPLPVISTA